MSRQLLKIFDWVQPEALPYEDSLLAWQEAKFRGIAMIHRAKLSVPVGQANRGGLVFIPAG